MRHATRAAVIPPTKRNVNWDYRISAQALKFPGHPAAALHLPAHQQGCTVNVCKLAGSLGISSSATPDE